MRVVKRQDEMVRDYDLVEKDGAAAGHSDMHQC